MTKAMIVSMCLLGACVAEPQEATGAQDLQACDPTCGDGTDGQMLGAVTSSAFAWANSNVPGGTVECGVHHATTNLAECEVDSGGEAIGGCWIVYSTTGAIINRGCGFADSE